MSETYASMLDRTGERLSRIADKVWSAAQPGAVFGEPVTSGAYTVITASEVGSGGGFGSGMGFGPQTAGRKGEQEAPAEGERPANAGGGGVGGGGGAGGRPVAVITIGPDGVRVQPVFDVTKIWLAAITAWGAMAIALGAMRKASKG